MKREPQAAVGSAIHRLLFLMPMMLLVGLLLQSCTGEAYKLGLISGLSGGNADSGEAGRNGALLAVEEANRMGGVKGRHIDLLIRDDGHNRIMAITAAQDLVNQRVEAIIGAFSTTMTEAVMTVTERAGMLVFTPTSSALQLVGKDDNLFRLCSSTTENAEDYADFMVRRRDYSTTTIAFDLQNFSFSQNWVAEFEKAYSRLGGEIKAQSSFNSLVLTGYNDLVEELLAPEPEAVLLVANSVDVARLAQQIRKVDISTPIIAVEWAGTQQLIELGGKAVEGVEVLQIFDKFGTQERFLRFIDEYRKRFKIEPNFSGVIAYETVQVILEAEKNRRQGESLKEAILRNSPYQGLQQEFIINEYGDTRRDSSFVIIRNQKFEKSPL